MQNALAIRDLFPRIHVKVHTKNAASRDIVNLVVGQVFCQLRKSRIVSEHHHTVKCIVYFLDYLD